MIKIIENTPQLETERLILRKFTIEDADAFYAIMNNKEVNTFLPVLPIETKEEAIVFLKENYIVKYERASGYKYAICLKV